MTQRSNLFYCATIVLVATAFNSCFSKPATSTGSVEHNDSKSNGDSKATINEIITETGENKISTEYSDYRSNYAAQMLSYMNQSVYPCDDFYEYACGNWKNVVEDHRSIKKRNNIFDMAYKTDNFVESILQRPDINDLAPEYAEEFELAKNFYHNCLEAELHPMRASPEYLAVLKDISVDKNSDYGNFHWLKMSAHLSNYGIIGFVNEAILSDYPFLPFFTIPNFGLGIELHHDTINNKSSNAYIKNEKNMRDILTNYGAQENPTESITSEIFDFLKKILKVLSEFDENPYRCEALSMSMDKSKVKTIKEKWRLYYDIAWMGKNFENFTGLFDETMPCFFLYEKLDRICEANKRAAANYLSLKFLFEMDARLDDKKYQKEFCISEIKSSMVFFFDHLFMKLYFSDELREDVADISKEIRQSLREILQDANWLDETSRNAALLKESKIVERIGRYEDPNTIKLLLKEFKKLKFINGSYEANHLNLRKFKQHMVRFNGLNYEILTNATKPLQLMVGMQPDCFYYNIDNSVYIMAGVLNAPIYNRAWPNSLKFGTLGFVIGHEFTHGFDTVGANYDESGKRKYWWSNKSAEVFEECSDCYVDHYKSYLIPEINRNINGNLTKDENIADGGALREAFMAYRRIRKNANKEFDPTSALYKGEQMPGLDLSPEQLFFLGFSQLWCASYKEANYWEELTNEHTIDKYRVLGALSNNDDFARAFNCPVGSKMNPSLNKCKVW